MQEMGKIGILTGAEDLSLPLVYPCVCAHLHGTHMHIQRESKAVVAVRMNADVHEEHRLYHALPTLSLPPGP